MKSLSRTSIRPEAARRSALLRQLFARLRITPSRCFLKMIPTLQAPLPGRGAQDRLCHQVVGILGNRVEVEIADPDVGPRPASGRSPAW